MTISLLFLLFQYLIFFLFTYLAIYFFYFFLINESITGNCVKYFFFNKISMLKLFVSSSLVTFKLIFKEFSLKQDRNDGFGIQILIFLHFGINFLALNPTFINFLVSFFDSPELNTLEIKNKY